MESSRESLLKSFEEKYSTHNDTLIDNISKIETLSLPEEGKEVPSKEGTFVPSEEEEDKEDEDYIAETKRVKFLLILNINYEITHD